MKKEQIITIIITTLVIGVMVFFCYYEAKEMSRYDYLSNYAEEMLKTSEEKMRDAGFDEGFKLDKEHPIYITE